MTVPDASTDRWQHAVTDANGLAFHYVEAGDGPLVLLLHGYPEFWYAWRHQIPVLADAGYRVVAPDLRGYNRTERPTGVDSYHIEHLADDITALIAALGHKSAILVGHDWGSLIAWETAMRSSACVDQLVVLNSSHPALFERELSRLRGLVRAWHMYAVQFPWLPERVLAANDFYVCETLFDATFVNEDAVTCTDRKRYRTAWAQPGALTAMLNYYRANTARALVRPMLWPRLGLGGVPMTRLSQQPVTVPTLVLWGDRTIHEPTMLDGIEEWVADVRIERIVDAGHWLHTEQPAAVNRLLLGALADE